MISELHAKGRILFCALALALLCAHGYDTWQSANLVSLSWVFASVALAELCRNLHVLGAGAMLAPAHAASSEPAAADRRDSAADFWLNHAPIALFRVDFDQPGMPVVALNPGAHLVLLQCEGAARAVLEDRFRQQAVGSRSIVWLQGEQGAERALLTASALRLHGERQHLLAWTPVENELEAETLGAWRELTYVLTHEIMNSLAAIVSLSRTAQELLDSVPGVLPPEIEEDLGMAFATIHRRTSSLGSFVDSYRTLSSVPEPTLEQVALAPSFRRLEALFDPAWRQRGGRATFTIEPPELAVHVDAGQLEQALINLLSNAADATAGVAAPRVEVRARKGSSGKVQIDVWDNGPGVRPELVSQIFVPFFSTKKSGGGIGLALVRQLLHKNGASIRYLSALKGGALFNITFYQPD